MYPSMNILPPLNLLLLGALLATSAPISHAADAPWLPLFNGKDLQGWVPMNDVTFQVVDGNLRLVKGMGWLRTEKQYKDFILEFEWRALDEKYDSGIYFRAGLQGKPWPDGGWQINLRHDALGGLVKGYTSMVPSETDRKPLHQWVKVRLEVRGPWTTLTVDGEQAWKSDKVDATQGYLGIQAENKSFDFRNLRIQELP